MNVMHDLVIKWLSLDLMLQDQFLFLPKVVGLCQDSNTRTGVCTRHHTCVLYHFYLPTCTNFTNTLFIFLGHCLLDSRLLLGGLHDTTGSLIYPLYCYWCVVVVFLDVRLHSDWHHRSGAGTMVITLWAPPVHCGTTHPLQQHSHSYYTHILINTWLFNILHKKVWFVWRNHCCS